MAHTPPDELDRVPSFVEQQRRPGQRPQDLRITSPASVAPIRCDACGNELDPALLRFRCESCPPPASAGRAAAAAAAAALRARREAS